VTNLDVTSVTNSNDNCQVIFEFDSSEFGAGSCRLAHQVGLGRDGARAAKDVLDGQLAAPLGFPGSLETQAFSTSSFQYDNRPGKR
jgi:hypothetical protein